jgi:signal transduction histidine kinase
MNFSLPVLLTNIIDIGIDADMERLEATRLRFQNIIICIFFIGFLVSAITDYIYLGYSVWGYVAGLLLMCILFWCMSKGWSAMVRHILCFALPPFVSILIIQTQGLSDCFSIFLFVIVMSVLLYIEKRLVALAVLYHIVVGITTYVLYFKYNDPDNLASFNLGSIFIFLLCASVIGFAINYYVYKNREIEKEQTLLIDKLKTKNEAIERFTYITAHDLKTPLLNISRSSELLKRQLINSDNKDLVENLNFILQGSDRMDKLINDVLQYSLLSSDHQVKQFEKERIDLNDVVHNLHTYFTTKNNGQEFDIELNDKLPSVEWDKYSIETLFHNVIENGIKFNDSQVPIIRISIVKPHTIRIEDNGIGIDRQYSDYIFEMFTRLNSHSLYSGSGLGLATCKRLVEEFGGRISLVKSNAGGSVFDIVLPDQIISVENTIV